MQENNNHTVLFALLKALRPIARFLMKAGIGYREFAEISKCAFVDVATSDYGLRGRPTNISRVAVMTGLTRKEVKRLRQKIAAGSQIVLDKVIPPAEIIQKWHTDPKFLDDSDRPLTLPFDGESPSFAELVKKFGGDIPPDAMRTELKRVGAVAESADGFLTVKKDISDRLESRHNCSEPWVKQCMVSPIPSTTILDSLRKRAGSSASHTLRISGNQIRIE